MIQEEDKSNDKRVFEKLIIQDNITGVRVLALEWTQEILENEVMKYKELVDEKIITEKELLFSKKRRKQQLQ